MKPYKLIINAILIVLYIQSAALADNSLKISQETAMAIARRLVGANTLEVIPYSDKNSKHQFIAVLSQDPESICCPHQAKVYLLEGIGQAFQAHDTLLTTVRDISDLVPEGFSQKRKSEILRWGVVDIDNDGTKEIFSIGLSYGSGGGDYIIQLYDSSSQEENSAIIGFSWGKPPSPIELNIKSKEKKEMMSDWLLSQSNKLVEQVGLVDQKDETFIWEQNNGAGFYKGKLKLHEVSGKVGSESSTVCTVQDGDLTWLSYFKGSVYGYSSKRDAHFLLYSPWSNYEWVASMIAGKTYLWIGTTIPTDKYNPSKRSLMAYNKVKHELETIDIPELGQILCSTSKVDCSDKPETISKGFSVKNSKLTLFGKALSLPSFVKPDEFKGATKCEQI